MNLKEIKKNAREEFVEKHAWESGTVDKPAEEILPWLDTFADRLVEEIEKAVVEEMRSPFRPDDKEFYNDVHRETGFVCARNFVKEAFNRFKGENHD